MILKKADPNRMRQEKKWIHLKVLRKQAYKYRFPEERKNTIDLRILENVVDFFKKFGLKQYRRLEMKTLIFIVLLLLINCSAGYGGMYRDSYYDNYYNYGYGRCSYGQCGNGYYGNSYGRYNYGPGYYGGGYRGGYYPYNGYGHRGGHNPFHVPGGRFKNLGSPGKWRL